jgi:histidine ammonia-lyase
LGEGEVYFEGKKSAFECCFETIWLATDCFTIKEGLALLNGTQFMSAYGAHIWINKFSYLADLIGTISLEAFDGRIEPFHELIHFIRPQKGK